MRKCWAQRSVWKYVFSSNMSVKYQCKLLSGQTSMVEMTVPHNYMDLFAAVYQTWPDKVFLLTSGDAPLRFDAVFQQTGQVDIDVVALSKRCMCPEAFDDIRKVYEQVRLNNPDQDWACIEDALNAVVSDRKSEPIKLQFALSIAAWEVMPKILDSEMTQLVDLCLQSLVLGMGTADDYFFQSQLDFFMERFSIMQNDINIREKFIDDMEYMHAVAVGLSNNFKKPYKIDDTWTNDMSAAYSVLTFNISES